MPRKSQRARKQGKVSFGASRKQNNRRVKRRGNAPMAIGMRGSTSNQYEMAGINDPTLGQGIRVRCSNTVCGVKLWSGYAYALDASPYWYIGISPDILSNGLGAIAKNFTYFRFVRLTFRYIPACPTTTSRNLRFAYVPDGGFGDVMSQPTYAAMADFQYSWSTAVWQSANYTINRVSRGAPAYQNYDVSGSTGHRQTWQGVLLCLTDSDPGATLGVGSIVLDCELELFDRTTSLNFTVNRRDYDEYMKYRQGQLSDHKEPPPAQPKNGLDVAAATGSIPESLKMASMDGDTVNVPPSQQVALQQLQEAVSSAKCILAQSQASPAATIPSRRS